MAKGKKKDIKNMDNVKARNTEEYPSQESSRSVISSEELAPPSIVPSSSDRSVTNEKSPIRVPTPEVYEQPDLAQYVVEKYEGDMVRGLYEGEGVAYLKNGNVYRGTFSEGLIHGKGKYTWSDGSTYEGEFSMNAVTGRGVYVWPNGNRYEGEVRNGLRNGFGKFTSSAHHSTYVGEWRNSMRHGKGKMSYDEEGTTWYDGEWAYGKKEGWGMQSFISGNIYEGQWRDNRCHGLGRMRWTATNEEYIGEWVNGKQNGYGVHIWIIQREVETEFSMRDVYTGNFVNGARHGKGQFNYADGSVYDGEWKINKKHGKAKFISLAGQVYDGEFIEDRMVDFPNNPGLLGIRKKLPNRANSSVHEATPSLLDTFLELDLSSLLDFLPEAERIEEMRQAEAVVLQHVQDLRKCYYFYSSLAKENLDNAFLMTKLQFWRFLKDCKLHHYNLTLAQIDRLLFHNADTEEVHSPFETFLIRTFLSKLIHLSYHICNADNPEKVVSPADSFSKILQKNILPNAQTVTGLLFSDHEKAVHAMSYIDKCWEIYKIYMHENTFTASEGTMRMRSLLWMLNDLNITNKTLNAKSILDLLVQDHPYIRIEDDANLEYEMIFLEFFEALLGCAIIHVTDEMMNELNSLGLLPEEQTSEDLVIRIKADITEQAPKPPPEGQPLQIAWKFTGKGQTQPVTFSCKKKTELNVEKDSWFIKIDMFFMKIFFPTCDRIERLKVEIPKIREQLAEKARLLQIEDEKRERRKALREQQEAIRNAEKEATASLEVLQLAKELAEEDSKAQLPVTPPKSTSAAPVAIKRTPGSKKKKKIL